MKKELTGLLLMLCMLLCACQLPQKNTEDVSDNGTSIEVVNSATEKTSYDEYYGTEFGDSEDVTDNDPDKGGETEVSEEGTEDEDTEAEPLPANPPKVYVEPVYNEGHTNLKVPTWIEYYAGLYFIVDCYNNQVIFSPSLNRELYEWQVLDPKGGFNRPHTIAFDGEVYMIDDTDNNRIVAYIRQYNEDGTVYFKKIQQFEDMGERPHYIKYFPEKEAFYAWSSMSGQMWVFKHSKDSSRVFLDTSYTIPDLKDVYVRSFTYMDGALYLVSGVGGDCCIYEVDFDTFEIIRKIPIAPELGGMVQINKIGDYYYASISTSLYGEVELRDFIRTDSLEHLWVGQYDSYLDYVTSGFDATPYNMTEIGGKYYLTLHRDGWGSGVVRFEIIDGEPAKLVDYFY